MNTGSSDLVPSKNSVLAILHLENEDSPLFFVSLSNVLSGGEQYLFEQMKKNGGFGKYLDDNLAECFAWVLMGKHPRGDIIADKLQRF